MSQPNADLEIIEKVFANRWHDGTKALKCNGVKEALNISSPAISSMKKYRGEEYASDVMGIYIGIANAVLNSARPMSDFQISIASSIICEEKRFQFLTVADVSAAVLNGCKGNYGPTYEGLDVMKICHFLDSYIEERLNYSEKITLANHNKNKAENKNFEMKDSQIEELRKFILKMEEKEKAQAKKPPYFSSLKSYCNHYGLDFEAKETEFVLKTAKEHEIDDKSDLEPIYQLYSAYRKRLIIWLRATNENNGYVSRRKKK